MFNRQVLAAERDLRIQQDQEYAATLAADRIRSQSSQPTQPSHSMQAPTPDRLTSLTQSNQTIPTQPSQSVPIQTSQTQSNQTVPIQPSQSVPNQTILTQSSQTSQPVRHSPSETNPAQPSQTRLTWARPVQPNWTLFSSQSLFSPTQPQLSQSQTPSEEPVENMIRPNVSLHQSIFQLGRDSLICALSNFVYFAFSEGRVGHDKTG